MNKLDKKFVGPIRKVKDGSTVPDDQWICFLAKDNAFAAILPAYLSKCIELACDDEQIRLVTNMIDQVQTWRSANPNKLKDPDAKGEKVLR